MKLIKLLLPAFLIAGTVCVQASRRDSKSNDSDYPSDVTAIAGFSSTISATTSLFASPLIGGLGTSIMNAPRSMWGE